MNRFLTWTTVLLIALVLGLLLLASCYKGTPPCQPGTVDWPRCDDLTQPRMWSRDGGPGRG